MLYLSQRKKITLHIYIYIYICRTTEASSGELTCVLIYTEVIFFIFFYLTSYDCYKCCQALVTVKKTQNDNGHSVHHSIFEIVWSFITLWFGLRIFNSLLTFYPMRTILQQNFIQFPPAVQLWSAVNGMDDLHVIYNLLTLYFRIWFYCMIHIVWMIK